MSRAKGRPTKYTKVLAAKICSLIVEGKSVRDICADDKMPGMATFFRWLQDNQEFREQYEEAKRLQADMFADEIMDIADDGRNDWMERERPDGTTYEVLNSEAVQRSKLRVDARKWIAARLLPKKYGDRVTAVTEDEQGKTIPIAGMVIKSE